MDLVKIVKNNEVTIKRSIRLYNKTGKEKHKKRALTLIKKNEHCMKIAESIHTGVKYDGFSSKSKQQPQQHAQIEKDAQAKRH